MIFKTHFELSIAMIGGFIVGWLTIFNDGKDRWLKGREVLQWALAFVMVPTVFFIVRGNMEDIEMRRVAQYAADELAETARKMEDSGPAGPRPDRDRAEFLRHGHRQANGQRRGSVQRRQGALQRPHLARLSVHRSLARAGASTYYVDGTGAALAVKENPRSRPGTARRRDWPRQRLDGGTCQEGRHVPVLRHRSQGAESGARELHYLRKIPAARDCKVEVVMGDARVSLERELKEQGPMNYDVIHLDAFSGDAIPAHLLTDESFDLYEQHLRRRTRDEKTGKKFVPIGIVVVHISNRYLDLEPVVAAIAKKHDYGRGAFTRPKKAARLTPRPTGFSSPRTTSSWTTRE